MSAPASLDYVHTRYGMTHYDFQRIDSIEICREIAIHCSRKANSEHIRATVYAVSAFALSILLGLSFLNMIALELFTIYFFSSDAWKKSEHYKNMEELAGLRTAELRGSKGLNNFSILPHS